MNEISRAKDRQRLARAIEQSYPRELVGFIDAISFGWTATQKHHLHSQALRYAKENYNAYDSMASDLPEVAS